MTFFFSVTLQINTSQQTKSWHSLHISTVLFMFSVFSCLHKSVLCLQYSCRHGVTVATHGTESPCLILNIKQSVSCQQGTRMPLCVAGGSPAHASMPLVNHYLTSGLACKAACQIRTSRELLLWRVFVCEVGDWVVSGGFVALEVVSLFLLEERIFNCQH